MKLEQFVPRYPKYKRFGLDDCEWYTKFYSNFDPYADFAFGNLLIWLDFNNDLSVSELNGNLIFRFTNILSDDEVTTTLIGKDNIDDTLLELFNNEGNKFNLTFVPESVVENLSNNAAYHIEEERESFDYLLDTHKLSSLLGPEMRKLRREVRYSIKDYGEDVIFKDMPFNDEGTKKTLINNLHTWDKAFTLTTNDTEMHEQYALNKSFRHSDIILNQSFGVYVHGELEGFIIYQRPPQKDYAILNHIKTSYDFRNIFDFMLFGFAARMHQHGVKFINFEQDLGLEGLRTHKLSLKPVGFLKKYSISVKN